MDQFPLPSIENIHDQIKFNSELPNDSDKLYIFGRNPEFSLGELVSLYNNAQNTYDFKDLTINGAIIHNNDLNSNLEDKERHISINKCGSILKRVKILSCFKRPMNSDQLRALFLKHFENLYLDEKPNWSISAYNSYSNDPEEDADYYELCKDVIRDALKANGIKKAYFVPTIEEEAMQPLRLYHKNIIQGGFEIVIWHRKKDLVIGHTEQVIDIDSFSERDGKRPFTRPLLLLGLAVARTMVNLVNIQKHLSNIIIYDPFCGMGSIVQEAILGGYSAWGSDIDGECVAQSRQNLEWLMKKMRIKKFDLNNIFRMDIKSPDCARFQNHIIGIVTEPDLLAPLKDYPVPTFAKKLIFAFEQNYSAYLGSFARIMSSESVAVLIFPRLHVRDHTRMSLNILKLLEKYQFEVCQFNINNIKFDAHFLHAWKEQIIEREIVVFQKKT